VQVDNDIRMYIMSRPKESVPPAVRQLLMPEGDAEWPGGQTASDNRMNFYPRREEDGAGQPFWEADILAQGVQVPSTIPGRAGTLHHTRA
jgi:hypothetical protein